MGCRGRVTIWDFILHFGVASLTSPVAKGCGKSLEELNHEYKPWNWVPAISGSALEIGWAQLFRRVTELLFLNIKRSQFKWFGYVTACLLGAFRSGVCGLAHWEGTQGQTQNILDRLHLSVSLVLIVYLSIEVIAVCGLCMANQKNLAHTKWNVIKQQFLMLL